MDSQIWVVGTLLTSIIIIILTIVKFKIHPFLALLLASFYVGVLMGMNPLEMVNAIEGGIGGTLGFLAAVIGLGTILGKMMEVSGAAERIGITLQKCRWLSPDVIMVLSGMRYYAVCRSGRGVTDSSGIFYREKDEYFAAEIGYSVVYRVDGSTFRQRYTSLML